MIAQSLQNATRRTEGTGNAIRQNMEMKRSRTTLLGHDNMRRKENVTEPNVGYGARMLKRLCVMWI